MQSYLRPICKRYSPPPPPHFLRVFFPPERAFFVLCCSWEEGLGSQLATYWLFQCLDPVVCLECITSLCKVTTCQVFRLRQDRSENDVSGVGWGVGWGGGALLDNTGQKPPRSELIVAIRQQIKLPSTQRWEPLWPEGKNLISLADEELIRDKVPLLF